MTFSTEPRRKTEIRKANGFALRLTMVNRRFVKKTAQHFLLIVAIVGVLGWLSYVNNLFRFSTSCNCTSDLDRQRELFTTKPQKHQAITFTEENTNETLLSTRQAELQYKTNLLTTEVCVQHYFLLILVSSAPPNVERRRDIRQTWAVDTALKPRWKTAFLVAQSRVQEQSDLLLEEENAFKDLIRADYYDHYWNQTLKIQMGFEWAARYCNFSFLLKMDDDAFVDTKALISVLNEPYTPRERLYLGRVYRNDVVHRVGKWKVSFEEYNHTHFPDFCPGFGFVLSSDVVHLFVDLFNIVPKFRLDDVYVGILADKVGVKAIHNEAFEVFPPPKTKCARRSSLVRHDVFGDCLFQAFRQTYYT